MIDIAQNSSKRIGHLFKLSPKDEPIPFRLSPLRDKHIKKPKRFEELYNRLARWNSHIITNSQYTSPNVYQALKLIYA